jgi:hypothetical protein
MTFIAPSFKSLDTPAASSADKYIDELKRIVDTPNGAQAVLQSDTAQALAQFDDANTASTRDYLGNTIVPGLSLGFKGADTATAIIDAPLQKQALASRMEYRQGFLDFISLGVNNLAQALGGNMQEAIRLYEGFKRKAPEFAAAVQRNASIVRNAVEYLENKIKFAENNKQANNKILDKAIQLGGGGNP